MCGAVFGDPSRGASEIIFRRRKGRVILLGFGEASVCTERTVRYKRCNLHFHLGEGVKKWRSADVFVCLCVGMSVCQYVSMSVCRYVGMSVF